MKTSKIITKKSIVPIATKVKFNIVDPIIFTGYPFGTPTMVSHIGTISGYTKDTSLISIQASTNKGNSGGALMDKDGNAIGIVSLREGGISLALQNYLEKRNEGSKHCRN